jgi:hypothetical protein
MKRNYTVIVSNGCVLRVDGLQEGEHYAARILGFSELSGVSDDYVRRSYKDQECTNRQQPLKFLMENGKILEFESLHECEINVVVDDNHPEFYVDSHLCILDGLTGKAG